MARPFSLSHTMFYVYLLHSEASPNQVYTGFTEDLRQRLTTPENPPTPQNIALGFLKAIWRFLMADLSCPTRRIFLDRVEGRVQASRRSAPVGQAANKWTRSTRGPSTVPVRRPDHLSDLQSCRRQ